MRLLDIAYRPKARAPMQTTTNTMVSKVAGVIADARGKPGKRQVTILSKEQWQQACDQLGSNLPWTTRRANLLVEGMQFNPDFVGKQIVIGELVLLVTGETDPCPKMDAQYAGLTQALTPDWRGGVCCKVLVDGQIKVGDSINIKD